MIEVYLLEKQCLGMVILYPYWNLTTFESTLKQIAWKRIYVENLLTMRKP